MTRSFTCLGALSLFAVSGCTGMVGLEQLESTGAAVTYESAACKVVYSVTNQWSGGFGADIQVTNKLGSALNGWKLEWNWPSGQTITQIWNATATQSAGHVVATNVSYNGTVSAGGTVGFGFNGAFLSANTAPTSFSLNGVSCTGASSGSGGTTGSGGRTGSGGAGSGGATGSGGNPGSGGRSCPFPTSFRWTSSGPLAAPKSPAGHTFVSLKDFTVTKFNNQFVVYATAFDTSGGGTWRSVAMNFADFSQMSAAPQTWLTTRNAVAPTLFYFTPKKQWVLTYQWGFQYATSTDPSNASSWSAGRSLLSGDPTGGTGTGPIDQTVVCDSSSCYLFFAADNGHIYRASMPIGSFPGTFTNATSILSDTTANLFEAVQVYTVKGTGKYLMIVEAMGGGGRYFRAFSSTSLGGTFTPVGGASTEAQPFAGKANVTFSGTAWTNDISHGDMVRDDPSEAQTIDPCNMRLLYQGRDPKVGGDYGALPYRPGLLTKTN